LSAECHKKADSSANDERNSEPTGERAGAIPDHPIDGACARQNITRPREGPLLEVESTCVTGFVDALLIVGEPLRVRVGVSPTPEKAPDHEYAQREMSAEQVNIDAHGCSPHDSQTFIGKASREREIHWARGHSGFCCARRLPLPGQPPQERMSPLDSSPDGRKHSPGADQQRAAAHKGRDLVVMDDFIYGEPTP
jgi:hypothetical protein